MLSLVVETDGIAPRSVRVDRLPARIGRAKESEVWLAGWRVAKVHAEIHSMERGCKLVDGGSIGGTWVNGERVAEFGPLGESDEILIAGYRLRVLSMEVTRDRRVDRSEPRLGLVQGPHLRLAANPSEAVAVSSPRVNPGIAGAEEASSPITAGHHLRGLSTEPCVAGRKSDLGASPLVADPPVAEMSRLAIEWRRLLHRRLLQTIDLRRKDIRQLSSGQLREEARAILVELIGEELRPPTGLDSSRLLDEVLDEAIGLGPLEGLLADPAITEIMVNAPDEIFVERSGRLSRCAVAFSGETAIRAIIDRIVAPVGRRIDESSPMVDARLPDGSRVNAVIPPLALRGSAITIRRFNRQALEPHDLIRLGSASDAMVEFLRLCVIHRRSVVISGGTGSGKTTLLNVLSNLIPEDERVVTIEDAAELRLGHAHLVSLEARPSNSEGRGAVTIRDLVRNALRMRPDRIVVGECRGGEALDMLQAMNTGHDGSLTTVHANSPRDVIARLETMVLMAGLELPISAIRDQIASAISIIVQQARGIDGIRRIVQIDEVTGREGDRVLMQPIYRYERGRFSACGAVPQFFEELRTSGVEFDDVL